MIYKCEKCKKRIPRASTMVTYIDCPHCDGKAILLEEYTRKIAERLKVRKDVTEWRQDDRIQ